MHDRKTHPSKSVLSKHLRIYPILLYTSPAIGGYFGVLLIDTYSFIKGISLWEMLRDAPIFSYFLMIFFAVATFCRFYVQVNALKKYVYVLERNRFDEAVEYGREYYSINRKGFLGIDGYGYNAEDDDKIAIDIETYCDN